MNGLERIDRMWAWICTDKNDGTEGVPALNVGGMAMPMYASQKHLAEKMRPAAEALAAQGHTMRLVEFASRITLDEITPSR